MNKLTNGMQILTYDEDFEVYRLTEVISVTGDNLLLEDIDPESDYKGMQWSENINELDWRIIK